jgi:hypothetical protein
MKPLLRLMLMLLALVPLASRAAEVPGVRAEYFNYYSGGSTTFPSTAATLDRIESTINVQGITASPGAGILADFYLVRYTGYLRIPATGAYTFGVTADDGVRLYVDCDGSGDFQSSELLIDKWVAQSASFTGACTNDLAAGTLYAFRYEYFDKEGGATAILHWKGPSPVGSTLAVIPASTGNMGLVAQRSDTSPPLLASATAVCGDKTQVSVLFSEQVSDSSAQTASNYTLNAGTTVTSAILQDDKRTVRLTVSPAVTSTRLLTVSNVSDLAGNTIAGNSQATVSALASPVAGVVGTYYDQNGTAGAYFTGNTITRIDSTIDFNWGSGSPMSGIPNDNFSVRWTGMLLVPSTGDYSFQLAADNGVRLYVNGTQVISKWITASGTYTATVTGLTAGTYVPLMLEYYEFDGGATSALSWQTPGSSSYVTLPSSSLFHCDNSASTFSGFRIATNSTASGCANLSSDVLITAVDSEGGTYGSYAGTVTLSTSTNLGDWSANTSPTPAGTLNNGSSNDGAATYKFVPSDNGFVKLSLSVTATQNLVVAARDTTVSSSIGTSSMLSFSTTADAFVLSEDTASKIAGIDVAVAGRPHDYKVTVTHVDASCASVTSTDYTGSHALKMWRTDSNGSWTAPTVLSPALTVPSAQPASSNITLNFTSGVASFNLGTTDIGRYTLSLLDDTQSYTSAPLSGSSNALTVRPFALVISHLICTYSFNGTRTNNINLGTTTGTPFCLAGGYFSAAVGAYRRSSSMTSNGTDANDDGVPDSTATWTNVTSGGLATSFNSPVTLKALAGSQTPSTGDLGTLDNGSVSGFSGGKATPTDLRYTEAGLFQLDSQSLVIDYLGSGLALNGSLFTVGTTPTSTSTFGRFAPARFAASNASVTLRSLSSCSPASSFNYLGEPFSISFTLTAQNALGATTKNYTGSFAKLDLGSPGDLKLAGASGSTVFSATSSSPRLSLGSISAAWGNGTGTAAVTVSATAERASSPDGPFDATAGTVDATFGIAPVDSDYTAMGSFDLDADSSVSGNDHKALVTVPLRFGRLRLQNVIMPRSLRASIPMVAQYWNGSAFVTNTLDSCTTVPANALNFGNYRLTMAASDTTVLSGGSTLTLSAGSGSIPLEPITSGHRGTLDIAISLGSSSTDYACLQPWTPGSGDAATAGAGLTYLRGAWCGSSYDRDPSARISYGLYRGADKLLHQRENY